MNQHFRVCLLIFCFGLWWSGKTSLTNAKNISAARLLTHEKKTAIARGGLNERNISRVLAIHGVQVREGKRVWISRRSGKNIINGYETQWSLQAIIKCQIWFMRMYGFVVANPRAKISFRELKSALMRASSWFIYFPYRKRGCLLL